MTTRRPASIRGVLCLLASISVWVISLDATADAQSIDGRAAMCTYKSKTYSDGALVCAGGTLVLGCSVEADRAIWHVTKEQDISNACRPRPQRISHRIRAAHQTIPASLSAKCFVFKGKTYCE